MTKLDWRRERTADPARVLRTGPRQQRALSPDAAKVAARQRLPEKNLTEIRRRERAAAAAKKEAQAVRHAITGLEAALALQNARLVNLEEEIRKHARATRRLDPR
jgi:hypothetical protein